MLSVCWQATAQDCFWKIKSIKRKEKLRTILTAGQNTSTILYLTHDLKFNSLLGFNNWQVEQWKLILFGHEGISLRICFEYHLWTLVDLGWHFYNFRWTPTALTPLSSDFRDFTSMQGVPIWNKEIEMLPMIQKIIIYRLNELSVSISLNT